MVRPSESRANGPNGAQIRTIDVLTIAEGVVTALACSALSGACRFATGCHRFQPRACVKHGEERLAPLFPM